MATPTHEDYLRAFYYLQRKNGTVRSSQLADYLGVSRPGVSEMLRFLDANGLVRAKSYAPAALTPKGLRLAKKITFKHRVLEFFLKEKLGLRPDRVHPEASVLEHAMSDEVAQKLYEFVGRPKTDPHGQPIEEA